MIRMIKLPPGIGDLNWMHSKLRNLPDVARGESKLFYMIASLGPPRTTPFANLLPECAGATDIKLSYRQIVDTSIDPYTPVEEIPEHCAIQFNEELLKGVRVEKFLPGLPITYHYPINTTDEHRAEALGLLKNKDSVGIFTSSYTGPLKSWGAWEVDQWVHMIQEIMVPAGLRPVIIGAKFDGDFCREVARKLREQGVECSECVGYHIGTAIETIRQVKLLVGFAAGIPILANMLKIPVVMVYPAHHSKLTTAWNAPGVPYTWKMWGDAPRDIYQAIQEMVDQVS